MSHLDKYVQYIKNTGRVPLPIAMFDEDHEPVGPMVRHDLVKYGIIIEKDGGITLRDGI